MNPKVVLPPLIALGMLVVIWSQTSEALKRSGTWTPRRTTVVRVADPYARLDWILSQPDTAIVTESLRDPFSFPRAPDPPQRAGVTRPAPPRPVPRPVVTAIVTDGEAARAILRYEQSSYSVKPGDVFAQFRVVSISADEVVVESSRERLVLRRPTKGD